MTNQRYVRVFNRGFFDRADPVDGLGMPLLPFSLYQVYEVGDEKRIEEICKELYQRVIERLQRGDLGEDIGWEIVDYQDAKQRDKEPPRRYIVVCRETKRGSRITVLARFLSYGRNLYLGVDSFVLGSLNVWSVVWRMVVTLLPLSGIATQMIMSLVPLVFARRIGDMGLIFSHTVLGLVANSLCCLFPWLAVMLPLLWAGVIRNYRQDHNLLLALRQSYNRAISGHSFNVDDILMTLKSILPLILYSAKDVFEESGLSVQSLDRFVENVMTVNNIQYVYGSYNAVVGVGGIAEVGIRGGAEKSARWKG